MIKEASKCVRVRIGHLRNPPPSIAPNKLSQIYLLFKVIRTQCGAKWCAPVSKILSSSTTQYVPCSLPGESFIIPTPTHNSAATLTIHLSPEWCLHLIYSAA